MESYLDITKGLHTDFEPIDQSAGTYRDAQNITRQLSGAIENEKGHKLTFSFPLSDQRVIGKCVIESDIIYFSYSGNSNLSEIGILDETGSYRIITNDPSLAFSYDIIVKAEVKKNFKGNRILYFVAKGLPMRVLNINNVPAMHFNDTTRLVITADMPQIVSTIVGDGGALPTGVYQFGIRLLTKSLNTTSVSLLSNPVSVVDETSTNKDEVDGAPPQTESNKAITISVANIDTNYSFIEIIGVTYKGTANVANAYVITRIPIQGNTTLTYVYNSVNQVKEQLDLNALVTDNIDYDSAELIIQKDGILVLGGLTAELSDYNFQQAANSITIKYAIREEVWQENIYPVNGVDIGATYATYPIGNDYKNPAISQDFRSYMRDEVYSFAIVPIFTNWNMGNAFHIPAPIVANPGNVSFFDTTADTTTKILGTYNSSEIYPVNVGYPTTQNRVRHHRMPTLVQEPHVQSRNGVTYIRMLGIAVDLTQFLATIPAAVKNKITGYVIVKQKRTEENKSILAQGIATGHATNIAVDKTGNVQKIITADFFSGKSPTNNLVSDYNNDMVAFYSPETIITKDSVKSTQTIQAAIELIGTSYLVSDSRAGHKKLINVLLNYNATNELQTLNGSQRDVENALTQYIEPTKEQDEIDSVNDLPYVQINGTTKVSVWKNPGYLFLRTLNGDLPINLEKYDYGRGELYYKYENNATDVFYLNNNDTDTANTGITKRHLYNLKVSKLNQYGPIYAAKYHLVKQVTTASLVNPIVTCFNGDVFITKFAVMTGGNGRITIKDLTFLQNISNNFVFTAFVLTGGLIGGLSLADLKGKVIQDSVTMKSLSYFWVESSVNCGNRHYLKTQGKEGDADYVQGTLPYYPKYKKLSLNNDGLFDYSSSLGHPTGYNKQYSFENTMRSFYAKSLEQELVTAFPNRLIYSIQSVEGEQLDAFRIFLPNNFHDIPKEKGKLSDLFILANNLYAHTERSLWKTYFNEQVTQATSSGEVYLGNGGVFYRPSTEVITVKGGYGGTKSSSGCTTPFGRFFIDQIQKKVFLFSETLEEISDQGMFNYFKNNIVDTYDKPGANAGYTSGFDYNNKRWLLTLLTDQEDKRFTLSYSTQLNSWSSFHTYFPYDYTSVGNRLYSSDLNKIYENNIWERCVFYSPTKRDSQLKFVINDIANQTKTLDNIVLFTTSQDNALSEKHYDTFNQIQVSNVTQNTGKCELIVPQTFNDEFQSLGLFQCFAKLKSNEFRIAVPSDLVLDVTQPILLPSNLDNSRAFRPRMQGKFFIVDLWYNNTDNNKLVLHNIGRIFRQRTR